MTKTILNQLGGNRFITMTGANYFMGIENGLRFRICKNKSKANIVKITLNSMDLYDVEFIKHTPFKFNPKTMTFREEKTETIETINNCYGNMLQDIFTKITGLYTHL